MALLLLGACEDEGGSSLLDGGVCPEEPIFGGTCVVDEQTCRYGYTDLVCGGRTMICRAGRWEELEHTDPQASCTDAGLGPSDAAADAQSSPDASQLCVPIYHPTQCSYVHTPGTATITAIEAPLANDNSCKNGAVTVTFTFAPDDPARAACFRSDEQHTNSFTFRVGDGKNPPRTCLDAASVGVGTTLRVERRDIAAGTCTPVLFEFPAALRDACASACQS